MVFYGVISSITDKGKTSANVFKEECDIKPESSSKSFVTRDVYVDYFDTLKEAEDFANQVSIS